MIVQIDGYSHEGDGVAHQDGRTYFVPGVLKGEIAEVLETGGKAGVTRCRLERLIQASAARQTPPCPFFQNCGGCALQHAVYPHQLEIKRDVLSRAFRVIGGFQDASVPPVIGMERIWGYRNKALFAVGETDDRIRIGFFGKGSRIIQGQGCPGLMSEQANRVLSRLTQMLERDRSWLRSRGLRHILLRESFSAGQMILVFFISNADSGLDAAARLFFAHLMEAEPSVAGAGVAISADTAKSGRSPGATRSQRSAAAGSAFPKAAVVGATAIDDGSPGDAFPKAASGEIRTVTGVLTLLERIGGQTFQISPESFFQVNTEGARRLYAVAADFLELTGKETLLDLYCGTGAVGLSLSPLAGRVVGIESVAEAVNDAKRNARRGGVRNAEFLTGRAEEWLPKLFESGLSPDAAKETAKGAVAGAAIDTVVLDPPRKGCAPSVLSSLIQAAPPRILYISCEPSTLARDLKILRQGGYAVRKIQPLDMFPQTFHVETVVLLARP